MPLSFTDLYNTFGTSWRISPTTSLLRTCDPVSLGNPAAPFTLGDISAQQRRQAQAVCGQFGVGFSWLDTCTMDVAVLGSSAAATYAGRSAPVVNGNPPAPPPCPPTIGCPTPGR